MSGRPYVTVEIEIDGEEEPRNVQLPANWEICSTCRGNGGHSLRFGAITEEDRRLNWDDESFQDYMSGAYDETCQTCEGTGKVAVVDREACAPHPDLAAALAYKDEQERIDAEIEAEHRAEMRYCYGLDAY